jgi:hypothetical protein
MRGAGERGDPGWTRARVEGDGDGDAGACAALTLPVPGGGGVVDRGTGGQPGCRGMAAGSHPPLRVGVSGETPCRWFRGQRRPWQSGRLWRRHPAPARCPPPSPSVTDHSPFSFPPGPPKAAEGGSWAELARGWQINGLGRIGERIESGGGSMTRTRPYPEPCRPAAQ